MLIATSCGHSPTNLSPPAILEIEGNGSCTCRGLTVTGEWGGGRKGIVGGSLIPNFSKGAKIFLTKILLVQIQKKKKQKP